MNHKEKAENGIFVKRKTGVKQILSDIYDLLERQRLLLPFLNGLLIRYRLYLTGSRKEYAAAVMGTVLKIYVAAVLSVSVIIGTAPTFFGLMVSVYIVYFFAKEFSIASLTRLELNFLKAFDGFLGIIRHYYYKCGSVKDALIMSESETVPLLRGHIREMNRCLGAADSLSEVNMYLNSGYHKYLKLFLNLVRFVEENGDVEDEKGSVFLNACMNLKYDIEEDIRHISGKRHRFSGYVYTAVLPVIAIPYIADWGVSTIPSLNIFYNGYAGVPIKVLFLVISFMCYNALLELRDGERAVRKRHTAASFLVKFKLVKRPVDFLCQINKKKAAAAADSLKRLGEDYDVRSFYMQKAICFILGFAVCFLSLVLGHAGSRRIYRNDISEVAGLTALADSRQITAMETLIPKYTSYYLDNGILPKREELKYLFLEEKDIRTEVVAETAADEVLKRIEQYEKEYPDIKDIMIALLTAIICMNLPNAVIFFKKSLMENRIRDEVVRFQSIIHMLKKIPGMSVVTLLEELERFSDIFRPVIRQCLNEYNISDEAALMRMYEAEKYPEFRRITDCFLMADELGIEDAFDEISSEIENFRENRKLDRKMMLDTEVMLGGVIAVLPGGLILFGYLLGPFMIRSVQIFNDYQAGLGTAF